MKKPIKFLTFALLAGLVLIPATTQAADQRSAVLANSCAGCHGMDGKSAGAIPSIAGLEAGYFAKAMKDFRSGSRKGSVMGRIAKGYSDEDIDLMAKHFAALK